MLHSRRRGRERVILTKITCAVRVRIDQAWSSIAARTPHIRDVLIEKHGLEKTGEDVYERGRKGVIYFDCEPTSLAYVERYFNTAGQWLSHQIGDHLKLGRRPKFEFVYDGLTPQGQTLLAAMADATAEARTTSDGQSRRATQDGPLGTQPLVRRRSQGKQGAGDSDNDMDESETIASDHHINDEPEHESETRTSPVTDQSQGNQNTPRGRQRRRR